MNTKLYLLERNGKRRKTGRRKNRIDSVDFHKQYVSEPVFTMMIFYLYSQCQPKL